MVWFKENFMESIFWNLEAKNNKLTLPYYLLLVIFFWTEHRYWNLNGFANETTGTQGFARGVNPVDVQQMFQAIFVADIFFGYACFYNCHRYLSGNFPGCLDIANSGYYSFAK